MNKNQLDLAITFKVFQLWSKSRFLNIRIGEHFVLKFNDSTVIKLNSN